MRTGNQYQSIAKLGAGGMAEIFLGVQLGQQILERFVVIKKLRTLTDEKSHEINKMFLDEARIIASLNHPHIVQIFDLTQTGDHFNIVMEYVDGESLSHVLKALDKQNLSIPLPITCRLMEQACEALQYAHTLRTPLGEPLNFVHRDIDPRNLMINSNGYLKVIDFGVSKASIQTEMTAPGLFKGKLTHLAPDVFINKDIDHRTDIYSLGLVLFEMATMHKAFHFARNEPVMLSIKRIIDEPLPDPCAVHKDLPRSLADIIVKASHKDRDKRYQSADEFSRDLRSFAHSIGGMATNAEVKTWFTTTFAGRLLQRRQFESRVLQIAKKKISPGATNQTSSISPHNIVSQIPSGNDSPSTPMNFSQSDWRHSQGGSPHSFVVEEAFDSPVIGEVGQDPFGQSSEDDFFNAGEHDKKQNAVFGLGSNKKAIAAGALIAFAAAAILLGVLGLEKESPETTPPLNNPPSHNAVLESTGNESNTASHSNNVEQKPASSDDLVTTNRLLDESSKNEKTSLSSKPSESQQKRKRYRIISGHNRRDDRSDRTDNIEEIDTIPIPDEETATALPTEATVDEAPSPDPIVTSQNASREEMNSVSLANTRVSNTETAVKNTPPENISTKQTDLTKWLSGNGNWSGVKVYNAGCRKCHGNMDIDSKTPSQWDFFFSRNRHRRYKDLNDYFSSKELSRVRSYMISKSKGTESKPDTIRGFAGVK